MATTKFLYLPSNTSISQSTTSPFDETAKANSAFVSTDYFAVTPTSGAGDSTLSVYGDTYTGRVARTATLVVTPTNKTSEAKKVTISQAKTEFVQFTASYNSTYGTKLASVSSSATSITLSGRSNSSKLTFTLIGTSNVTAAGTNCQTQFINGTSAVKTYNGRTPNNVQFQPYVSGSTDAKWNIGSTAYKSGTADSSIGTTAQYEFSITIVFQSDGKGTANDALLPEYFQLKVTDNAGHTDTVAGVREAAAVSLTVGSNAISLDESGTSQTFSVTTNDVWDVTGA